MGKKNVPDVLLTGDHAKIKELAFSSIRGYNTTPTFLIYGKNIKKINEKYRRNK